MKTKCFGIFPLDRLRPIRLASFLLLAVVLLLIASCGGQLIKSGTRTKATSLSLQINGKVLSIEVPDRFSNAAPSMFNNGQRFYFSGESVYQDVVKMLWDYGDSKFQHVGASNNLVVSVARFEKPLDVTPADAEFWAVFDDRCRESEIERVKRANQTRNTTHELEIPSRPSYEVVRLGESQFLYYSRGLYRELLGYLDANYYLIVRVSTGVYRHGDWVNQAVEDAEQIIQSVRINEYLGSE